MGARETVRNCSSILSKFMIGHIPVYLEFPLPRDASWYFLTDEKGRVKEMGHSDTGWVTYRVRQPNENVLSVMIMGDPKKKHSYVLTFDPKTHTVSKVYGQNPTVYKSSISTYLPGTELILERTMTGTEYNHLGFLSTYTPEGEGYVERREYASKKVSERVITDPKTVTAIQSFFKY